MRKFRWCALLLAACLFTSSRIHADEAPNGIRFSKPPPGHEMSSEPAPAKETGTKTGKDGETPLGTGKPLEVTRKAVNAKPLTKNVDKGLSWLVEHQLKSGGWGQGDESPNMGQGMAGMRDTANVADTCMAALALIRGGHTPSEGRHKDAVRKAVGFVLAEVEASDSDSLAVTKITGTRVQGKIGAHVDTFTALLLFTEVKGKMGSSEGNARVDRALAKVIKKIEKNQNADGSWKNDGWAPVLSQSVAAKGLNRAAQGGAAVGADTLARVEQNASAQAAAPTGAGSAGVGLYGQAASNSALKDSAATREAKRPELERIAKESKDKKTRDRAKAEIAEGEAVVRAAQSAEKALLARLDDPNFIRGFGSNGGEEFLSYMLVSEALIAKGGGDWEKWDKAITKLVNGVQNEDGSWSGHHCITGRTFCTAAALMVLMGDRAPGPVVTKLKKG